MKEGKTGNCGKAVLHSFAQSRFDEERAKFERERSAWRVRYDAERGEVEKAKSASKREAEEFQREMVCKCACHLNMMSVLF